MLPALGAAQSSLMRVEDLVDQFYNCSEKRRRGYFSCRQTSVRKAKQSWWLPRSARKTLAEITRYQIVASVLAHQLGFPLPNEVACGIWNWEKLWKECGSPRGPG